MPRRFHGTQPLFGLVSVTRQTINAIEAAKYSPTLELAFRIATAAELAALRPLPYPDLALAGTITYVAPSLDEKTRSLPIRVTLEATDPRLRA